MQNKELVAYYYEEAWNKNRMAVLQEILSPEYRRRISPALAPLTAAEQITRMAAIRAAFPDIQMNIQLLIEEGDMVCAYVLASCMHKGKFMGVSPTDKHVRCTALELMRIQGGQITEHWGGPDVMDMLRQIQEPKNPQE